MIHVVSIHNQYYYGRQLDEMFRMRHDFYVEGHGWSDLQSRNNRETDEFDNEDAVYLISLDKFGHVAAAMRLNPTIGANLTARLTRFVDGDPPHSPEIWDMTRWIVAPRYRGQSIRQGAPVPGQELACGLMEFALKRGLSHFSMIAETALIPRLDHLGWRYHKIGPETAYENGKGVAQALLLEANPESLMKARAFLGVFEDVLFELGPVGIALEAADELETESRIAQEMARLGRVKTVHILRDLTDRLADKVGQDPATAVEAIMSFSDLLLDELVSIASDDADAAAASERSNKAS